ncbi:MAG: hypothetical protein E7L01_15495 [Paenibacillus macerans]|uniref:Putative membrane protein n=1 Tax=Paenibacillus macerans TaxID=44252 RepID=A0A090ZK10_PAEMA|nr:hypothetical protein [Paenibacillus macerans]KFN11674.1 putative membrane protein [Paenibacillus macerans]MBS5911159.1 hypothetical protein [Paenibacillus macerans]MCY7562333.1 hypothetical protein [Paenibacillus macerans]MDU7474710.1 hypothetical protein [Paenibacillus macerans]MEC0149016.1 hypothetical protein [Paenibacillus macerans]
MGNSTFNKNLFLEIYAGEITEEFETNFVSKFGIAYKDFLELELKNHNNNTNELAKFIGLKENQLLLHLKSYSIIKNLKFKEWLQFLMGNMFVYLLKAALGLIGSIPIFYFIGYLLLYGYFFGGTDHSFLDVVMRSVPINRSSCYIAGFIFSGIVTFFISIYKLKGLGKAFLIFGLLYFFFAPTVSLLIILFSANFAFEFSVIIKFLLVWLLPVLTAVLIISASFLITILSKHYKAIGLVIVISSLFPIFMTRQLGLKLSLTIYLLIVVSLNALVIKLIEKNNKKRNEIGNRIVLSTLFPLVNSGSLYYS